MDSIRFFDGLEVRTLLKRAGRFFFSFGAGGMISLFVLFFIVYWVFSASLPKIISLADYRPLGVTRVISRNEGKEVVIGEFFKERRYLVPIEKIPQIVTRAFVAAEDDKFYEHKGISLTAILRASFANFRAGHVVQGGSTITQQVAKSLFLSPERSYVRKIKEAILSARIETNLTKEQILYLYLNQIYLGRGAYGIQAASQVYFNKDVTGLSVAEAALLAGMPQAPSKYNPFSNAKRAKERQLYVLRRLVETGAITEEQMLKAAAEPLKIQKSDTPTEEIAPYYTEHVRRYLVEKYGEKSVYEDGMTVLTPTRPDYFKAAAEAVQEGLRIVDKRRGYRGPVKHLEGEEQVEKFCADVREELIDKKVAFRVLMPDGRLDHVDALNEAGVDSEEQLVDVGKIYPGVVAKVDDVAKKTIIRVGNVRTVLPMSRLSWVYSVHENKLRSAPPRIPSEIFKAGDVVWVRVVARQNNLVETALEQRPEVQGALYSIEVKTGHVLAVVGGFDFSESEFNRASQAKRQPGSAYKPVIFSAGLEKGFTPASIIVDSPIVYEDNVSGKWRPENFSQKFYGDTTYRQALIKSRNIPTIKIVEKIGVPDLIEYSRRMGMLGQFNQDLSISLGSGTTTLQELTEVYSIYPRLGRKIKSVFITKVIDRDGQVLEENKPQLLPEPAEQMAMPVSPAEIAAGAAGANHRVDAEKEDATKSLPIYPRPDDLDQVMDPRIAFVMTHLMKEVVDYGTGSTARGIAKSVAGKTGTTNEYKDAWFLGFTPNVVTGVWVGFDESGSLGPGETGAKAALPIWIDYMKAVLRQYPDTAFSVPPGVTFSTIDYRSGKLIAPHSEFARVEAFIEGTEPTRRATESDSSIETESEFLKEEF